MTDKARNNGENQWLASGYGRYRSLGLPAKHISAVQELHKGCAISA